MLKASYTPLGDVICCCLRGKSGCLELQTPNSKHQHQHLNLALY